MNINNEKAQSIADTEFAFLYKLSANEQVTLSFLIATLLGQNATMVQQAVLGNFFELIGQVLLSLNAQNQFIDSSKTQNSNGN